MGSSGKNRKRGKKEKSGRDENSNLNAADDIPENSREAVQILKEIVNHSEQEIYAMLVQCDMDADEAITRLLSRDCFQAVKSKRNKKKEAKEKSMMGKGCEDSNVNGDNVSADSREEIVNCSEQETSTMLVECDMDTDKAVNGPLTQDSSQRVNSKQDKTKETKDTSDFHGVRSCNQNGEFRNGFGSETSYVQGIRNHLAGSSTTAGILGPHPSLKSGVSNVKKKRVPKSSGKAVSSLSVPSSRYQSAWGCGTPGQRTMADVVKMGLGSPKESITKAPVNDDSLLPEKPVVPNPLSNSVVESAARRDQLQESASVSNQNLHDGDDGDSQLLCDNNNNKNDETDQVQRGSFEHNQSSLKESVTKSPVNDDSLLPEKPVVPNPLSNSLVESAARRDQLQESASISNQNPHDGDDGDLQLLCDQNNNKNDETDQVQRGSFEHNQSSLKENVTKAPINDDSLLPEKPVVPNALSNSLIESAARRDRLQESASVSNQNLHDGDNGGSQLLCDNYDNKNDETDQVRRGSFEQNQTKDPLAPVHLEQCIKGLQHLGFGLSGSEINGSGQPSGLASQFLNLRDGECHEQQLRTNVANEQVNSNGARNYHSSPNYDQTEPSQENHYTSSYVPDFTFDYSQLVPMMVPSGRSLPMQDFKALISDDMLSMPTSSPLGRMLSVSMTEMNRQAMNHHHKSQANAPSGHYGNMMNYPCSLPTQNGTHYMPPSAFQRHGGINNNAYHRHSLVAPLPQYRNSDLHQPAVAVVPSPYASTNGSTYDSAYGFGMLRDDTASSIFWDEFRSKLSNPQNRNVLAPQGHNDSGRDCYSLFRVHQNQQSPGSRYSQREQLEQPYRRIGYEYERSSRYYASLDQQHNRRDPSNQTQQQPRPRNNY